MIYDLRYMIHYTYKIIHLNRKLSRFHCSLLKHRESIKIKIKIDALSVLYSSYTVIPLQFNSIT